MIGMARMHRHSMTIPVALILKQHACQFRALLKLAPGEGLQHIRAVAIALETSVESYAEQNRSVIHLIDAAEAARREGLHPSSYTRKHATGVVYRKGGKLWFVDRRSA